MNIDKALMAEKALEAERFLKMIANQNRLMILCALMDSELAVGELNDEVPLSQSALSQHLSKLREAGLVATRRESQTIFYRLDDDRVMRLLPTLYQVFCQ